MAPAPAEPGQRFYTMLLPGIPAAGGWLVGVPPALAEEPGEAQPASSCAARSRTCCVAVADSLAWGSGFQLVGSSEIVFTLSFVVCCFWRIGPNVQLRSGCFPPVVECRFGK